MDKIVVEGWREAEETKRERKKVEEVYFDSRQHFCVKILLSTRLDTMWALGQDWIFLHKKKIRAAAAAASTSSLEF